jgi:hypothetical protein
MRKTVSILDTDTYTGFAAPQAALFREQNIPRAVGNKIVKTGEVDSFIFGDRFRYITLESFRDYIRRCLAGGLPRDPAVKAAAVANYRASLSHGGARLAAQARAGWGPNHGKGRKRRTRPAGQVDPLESASPQPGPPPPKPRKSPARKSASIEEDTRLKNARFDTEPNA